jgi:ABC-type Fe3+ transport system permease subunit
VKSRVVRHLLPAAGGAVFVLAFVAPTLALLARCVLDGASPRDGFSVSDRQWGLLAKSILLAGAGTVTALGVSLPGAYVVARVGRLSRRPVLTALLAAPLWFPPMVYVFGWQRLLPAALPASVQCVGVWALWAYPIPALLLGTAWSRLGRGAYEAALLETTPAHAFLRAVLPLLVAPLAAAAMVLFIIFLGEYSVPHACGVLVYATELLGWSEESARAIDTLWPSLPLTGAILLALMVTARIAGGGRREEDPATEVPGVRSGSLFLTLLAGGCFALAVLLPLAALSVKLKSCGVMTGALRTYGMELLESLLVTGGSGLLVVGMGVGVAAGRTWRRIALLWALGFGALPGALVGEALLSAYQSVTSIYDHWPMVVLGYVARFGWIGMVVMELAERALPQELAWQARADGADDTDVTLRISAALSWPTLLFGVCLAAALALAELPTSTLVRVPTLGLIAHILIEKFHRFEEGMLISLSLWLVLAAIPAAVLPAVLLRTYRTTRSPCSGPNAPRPGGGFSRRPSQ